jgi:hypothetical protein
MKTQVRKNATKLLDLIEQGVLDPMSVLEAALNYMSDDDVEDMAWTNDFLTEDEEESEDEEDEDEE